MMSKNTSPIWKGFLKIYHRIGMNLHCKVGNGRSVMVGIDPIIGPGEDLKFSTHITNYLAKIGYYTLAHIRRPLWIKRDYSYWYTTKYLGLVHDSANEWEDCIRILNLEACRLSAEEDSLIW